MKININEENKTKYIGENQKKARNINEMQYEKMKNENNININRNIINISIIK